MEFYLTFFAILIAIFPCESANKSFELLLLHINDLRANIDGAMGNKIGGYPKIGQIVHEARESARNKSGPPVLFLNAGDIYTDRVWSDSLNRKILIEFANRLNPDAASLGCHNFYDPKILAEFLAKINFPLIASNVDLVVDSERYRSKVKKHLILRSGRLRIGIVAYVTPNMHYFNASDNGTFVYFHKEIDAVREEVKALRRRRNVDFIIALGHSGIRIDEAIAREIDGIDLIVGGLSYNLYWNGPPPGNEVVKGAYPIEIKRSDNRSVLLLHTYGFAKYLGRILLKFDDANRLIDYDPDPIFLDETILPNKEMVRMLDHYKQGMDDRENPNEVLAQCIIPLDAQRIREAESNLANSVTDFFTYHLVHDYQSRLEYSEGYWTNTSIALINAGAIRASLNTTKEKPDITRAMIKEIMPYRQHLVRLTLSGSVVVESLENGVRSNGETSRGEFLQVSGLRVTIDYKGDPGSRILWSRVRCAHCAQPTYSRIDPIATYGVVVTAFIANGGDGHVTFKQEGVHHTVMDIYDVDVLTNMLTIMGRIRPENDERIEIVTSVERRRIMGISEAGSLPYRNFGFILSFICRFSLWV